MVGNPVQITDSMSGMSAGSLLRWLDRGDLEIICVLLWFYERILLRLSPSTLSFLPSFLPFLPD